MSAAAVKTVLFVCGSYNPPTNMHMRMFELARDHLCKLGYNVCGGIMSPVHDKYGKKDLVSSLHRCEMVRLALENSSWIKVSDWEAKQLDWTRTRVALDHHEDELNQQLNNQTNDKITVKRPRHDSDSSDSKRIQVMLLCGADVLESMGIPNVWDPDDINHIAGHHGIVVITRGDTNPAKFIYQHDILSTHMNKIVIVNEWIRNEISSTHMRRALKRGDSVKYLIDEKVERYIFQHGLYSVAQSPHIEVSPILDLLSKLNNNFLTNGSCDTSSTPAAHTKSQSQQHRSVSRTSSGHAQSGKKTKVSKAFLIYGGGEFCSGQFFYVDNIRKKTEKFPRYGQIQCVH
uniref:Nicotinamide-nucleotide adenylyltransferase n=1 Tax=Cacopsylla melanoneura TaxID=428564 RepID=A0A8D8UGU2_9HEMI